MQSGEVLHILGEHTSRVYSAAYSPNGAYVVSAGWDNTVRLWNAASDELLATLEGHTQSVFSLAYSPDGAYIVSASWDGTARIWGLP